MVSLTAQIKAVCGMERSEEVERQALLVEERSCVAHLVRKHRLAMKGHKKIVDSDDDDDASIAKAHAEGSSLLFKFKLVAERRQVEWDLYETRCRELRRRFEETNDPKVFDTVQALPKPGLQKTKATAPVPVSPRQLHGDPTAIAAPVVLVEQPLMLPNPPAVMELPPEVKAAMQTEGFSRASIVMEERASRLSLSNSLRISVIEGDDEMRARTWNRESYDAEMDRREQRRDAEAAQQRQERFREITSRHKAIGTEQTNRVFLKKMLREKRVAIQFDETQKREGIEADWAKWFNISIVLLNFKAILVMVPEEEAVGRGMIMGKQWNDWQRFILRMSKYYQRTEALSVEMQSAMDELFDTETFMMRYHIEMFEKTQKEQEDELKRRDVLRQLADAEELERIKLEAKYGASPLTIRPGSADGRSRLVLRPQDELEIIKARHPPSGITDAVRQAFRSNQDNNALFMALEPKYMKVRRNSDGAANSVAAPAVTPSPSSSLSPKARNRTPPPQLEAAASAADSIATAVPRYTAGVAVVSPKLDAIHSYDADAPVSSLKHSRSAFE